MLPAHEIKLNECGAHPVRVGLLIVRSDANQCHNASTDGTDLLSTHRHGPLEDRRHASSVERIIALACAPATRAARVGAYAVSALAPTAVQPGQTGATRRQKRMDLERAARRLRRGPPRTKGWGVRSRDVLIGLSVLMGLWLLFSFRSSIPSIVEFGRCASPDGTCPVFFECMVPILEVGFPVADVWYRIGSRDATACLAIWSSGAHSCGVVPLVTLAPLLQAEPL